MFIIKTKAGIISLEFQLVLPDDKALRAFLSKIVSKFTEGPKNRPACSFLWSLVIVCKLF